MLVFNLGKCHEGSSWQMARKADWGALFAGVVLFLFLAGVLPLSVMVRSPGRCSDRPFV